MPEQFLGSAKTVLAAALALVGTAYAVAYSRAGDKGEKRDYLLWATFCMAAAAYLG